MYAFVLGRGCRRRFLPALSGMADERAKARFFEKKGPNGEDRLLLKPLPIEKSAGAYGAFGKYVARKGNLSAMQNHAPFGDRAFGSRTRGRQIAKNRRRISAGSTFFMQPPAPSGDFRA